MIPTGNHPILVVEDDEDIRTSIAELLTDEGYYVVTAANGKEALDSAKQHLPRLILLDMKMPVLDGWGFVAAYRERPGTHSPIIVMTASQDSRAWAAEIAADCYISKPFDIEHLLRLVNQYAPLL